MITLPIDFDASQYMNDLLSVGAIVLVPVGIFITYTVIRQAINKAS